MKRRRRKKKEDMTLNFKKHPSLNCLKVLIAENKNTTKLRAAAVRAAACLPIHLASHHSEGAQMEQDMNVGAYISMMLSNIPLHVQLFLNMGNCARIVWTGWLQS